MPTPKGPTMPTTRTPLPRSIENRRPLLDALTGCAVRLELRRGRPDGRLELVGRLICVAIGEGGIDLAVVELGPMDYPRAVAILDVVAVELLEEGGA